MVVVTHQIGKVWYEKENRKVFKAEKKRSGYHLQAFLSVKKTPVFDGRLAILFLKCMRVRCLETKRTLFCGCNAYFAAIRLIVRLVVHSLNSKAKTVQDFSELKNS